VRRRSGLIWRGSGPPSTAHDCRRAVSRYFLFAARRQVELLADSRPPGREGYARSPSHLGCSRSPSAMAALRVRRDNAALSGGCEPTWRALQPEATGAVMDVTKWLNPQQGASGARRLHSGAVAPRATKAPPDERGGNRHAQPNATAPHSYSTDLRRSIVTNVARRVELTCLNLLSGTVAPGASFLLRHCPLCGPSLSLRSACPSEGPALSGPSPCLDPRRKGGLCRPLDAAPGEAWWSRGRRRLAS
jgi:hypothetical protein